MPKNEKFVKFNAFRLLCLKNAEDALNGATLLLGKNLNHLVFHLCILSLEEVGKIFMTWMKINQVENWDHESTNIAIDDHVKKLFFAIWGPSIGKDIIDKTQWNENKHMANKLHELRLFSLYGAWGDTTESSRKLNEQHVKSIYEFTKRRLDLAKIEGEVMDEDGNVDTDLQWFEEYLQIPGKRDSVFGKIAQEKLIELGDVNNWIKWLRETHEKEEQELHALAENEINRKETTIETLIPKWEFTFTVVSPSHSIRQKELTYINKFDRPFKFQLGKDRHTLIIKQILPSIVTVHTLWQQGWFTCKLFVAALNIAARGLFYWHAPKDFDRFYDTLEDLESGKKLTVSIDSKLKLNWVDYKMYLSEQQLHLTFLVYEYFLRIGHGKDTKHIMDYMAALAMFARTDIHLRFELNAFMIFFNLFRDLIKKHEKLSEEDDVFEIGFQQIAGMLKNNTKEEYDKSIRLALSIDAQTKGHQPVTLTEVVAMKNYCDIYLLTIAVRIIQNKPGIRLVPDQSEPSTF